VPADAILLSSRNLEVDESLLTGESAPVRKVAGEGTDATRRPGGDDLPFVFSGTLVVRGQGHARVDATGARTEMGRIGKTLETVVSGESPLQRETSKLVRRLAAVGLALCGTVAVIYGLTRDSWLDGLLAGIALAMALLPEEFPIVLTIFLALGAWRLSRRHVLTRNLPAIESLGAATVLCVDKTGTLTWNRMSVRKLVAGGSVRSVEDGHMPPEPEFRELVEYAALGSQPEPFDPMEQAIHSTAAGLRQEQRPPGDWRLVREYPLSPALLAMSHVWESAEGDRSVAAAKGAPEAIVQLCRLPEEASRALLERVGELARDGLRVVGVAKAVLDRGPLPDGQRQIPFELAGLIGLADPVRPTVPDAIRECRDAGIRVVMVTGDYPETARSIARQVGLSRPDEVVTGPELERLTGDAARMRIAGVNVFARVLPEQKLHLVRLLLAAGEVVAMTGDGVNDAPALKAADIGIAMGQRGTDVAREASDLVLVDDDFSSIVAAVRSGRRIDDNLRKALAYILAIHVPIAGLSLLPVLIGWPLILLPLHIVFLEMIIDPACSLVFEAEPEEPDVMNRPPRDPRAPLFSRRMVGLALLQGASVLLVVLAVFGVAFVRGQGAEDARALAFTTLIVANLGLILTNRSRSATTLDLLRLRNRALRWVLVGAVGVLGLVLSVPALRDLFRFSRLHFVDLAFCLAAGVVSVLGFELLKLWRRRRMSSREGGKLS
jgi:Ca2+-transporting ATPase